MPKLVTLQDVLHQVYIYGDLNRTETERPMSYKTFKRVMLGSELVVTERTIRQKWDQIIAANFARESRSNRGTSKDVVILNVPSIINELIYKKMIVGDIVPCNRLEQGAHTQTHTQTEVSS